ncbi:hypothetical protein ACKKBG_A11175 [Auxenochlorella protothecoides x Auxenochlorella symbiontica]|uniref:Uncharacterized protein n=1 Tax=Auxenochlorella protothecoides TaxID=3075 RepID=A0A087SDR7_AUXPR|nr:hypothetical protein F751_6839 [Auxenochlorella protothecoides]KFM23871.1 hypothetical protein F751_6839 [Auxenochlorella protothecoides]
MGSTGGCKTGNFNGRMDSWQKRSKTKARVAKKQAGTLQAHKARVKRQSGVRTKKHQKRVEHAKKMAAKAVEEPADAMQE